jgi:hypothetical protein
VPEDSRLVLGDDELQIVLNVPLTSALVVDRRRRPAYRWLMRLPWRMSHDNMVRINVEPFDQPPDSIPGPS